MVNSTERIETGIKGLDPLIQGGLVKGSTNMLAGMTGTCKTIFSTQFLWHGLQKGEPGIYITLEQSVEDILSEAAAFGFDFNQYIGKGSCLFVEEMPSNFKKLEKSIFDKIVKMDAKRLVLDSLSIMTMSVEESTEGNNLRRDMFRFMKALKTMGVTSILITEIPEDNPKKLSRYGLEEFLVDGVITLNYLEYASGGLPRSLMIRKMRYTSHGIDIYPFDVTKNGIVVKKG